MGTLVGGEEAFACFGTRGYKPWYNVAPGLQLQT